MRKIISTILALVIISSITTTAMAVAYPDGEFEVDVGDIHANAALNCSRGEECLLGKYTDTDVYDWYHDGLHHLTDIGVISGYSSGEFGALDNATRAQVIVLLWRLQGSPVVNYLMQYKDVSSGDWYSEAIRWATSERIVSGYGNGYFGPNDELSRQQLASILYKYNIAIGKTVEADYTMTHTYTYEDLGTESSWAVEPLKWSMNNHLMVGEPGMGGKLYLNPMGTVSRGQLVQIISRMAYKVF